MTADELGGGRKRISNEEVGHQTAAAGALHPRPSLAPDLGEAFQKQVV
jgi:hypothetical protein